MRDTRTPNQLITRTYTTSDGKVHEHLPPAKRHESKITAVENLASMISGDVGVTYGDVESVLNFLMGKTIIIKTKTLIASFSSPMHEVKDRIRTSSVKVQKNS